MKLRTRISYLTAVGLFTALGVSTAFPGTAQMFEAAIATRDITPEPGLPLWGYGDRTSDATGTLDPLMAKAVALRAGGKTAVLVALDLGRPPMPESRDRILGKLRPNSVDGLYLVANHTHHAPYMEFTDQPYVQTIENLIAEAVNEAVQNLAPAKLGLGATEIDIAHNRRKYLEDGRVFMLWRNEDKVPTSPVDKEATLIRIDSEDGSPLAVLVHYACHPVVMGPSNVQYSADYVGEMARLVERETKAECVFLQGACGDINPYLDKTPLSDGGVNAAKAVGKECADAVSSAWKTITTKAPDHPSVALSDTEVEVGLRWDPDDKKQAEVVRNALGARYYDKYVAGRPKDLKVPLSVIVLNGDLALVGMPGEIFVQYQVDLKQRAPIETALLMGYTNDYHAYFPTVKDAAAGGYGGITATYVGIGAGDQLYNQALVEIGRLTGGFKAFHEAADFVLVE